MEGGEIPRITGDIKFGTIHSNKGIFSLKLLQREPEIKLFKKMVEGLGQKLGPLLNEGGNSRQLIRVKEKIF